MLLSALPTVAIASAFLLAPGVVWAWWRYPAADGVTRVCVGLALGLTYQMHIVALLAAGPGITAQSVFAATLLALAITAILVWRTHAPRLRRRKGDAPPSALPLVGLLLLLLVIAAVRLAPLAVQQIPMGWDSSFHSLLASVTVTSGRLPSWAPYERMPINYPYGPHTFIAEISLLTGVAPDRVFAALISGVFPVLTCLALYALTLRLLRGSGYALAAVAAYGLLGYWGSVNYAVWGGLPNEIGCFLALTFFAVLFTPNATWRHIIVGGLILGAIPLAHHHVMLTVALLLVVFTLYLLARRWRGDYDARWLLRNLVLMALVAVVSIAYYALPIALRAGRLQDTDATFYREELGDRALLGSGVALEILAVAGALIIYARPAWRERWLGVRLRATRPAREFLAMTTLTLLGAYVAGYYLYGYISYAWLTHGQTTYSLFTPSRFLTDLTYFLAIYAAIPLVALWRWLGVAGARFEMGDPGAPQVMGFCAQGALLLTLLAVACSLVPQQFDPGAGRLAAGEAPEFAWVRAHTPADAVALNVDATAHWAPYFTGRESAITPIPTSEFSGGYAAEKQYLSGVLWMLLQRPPTTQIIASAGTGTALPALLGRPVAVLTTGSPAGLVGSLAFASGDQRVFLLANGYDRLRPAAESESILWWTGATPTPPEGWQTGRAGSGWSADPDGAMHHSVAYLRLMTPLPAGAAISCRAQHGADLWLDGRLIPQICDGALHSLTSASGSQTLALRVRWSPRQQPWGYLFVISEAPSLT
jgi:hypothetical protein